MNFKASHIGFVLIALMALSMFSVFPAKSWVYPDGTPPDSKYEMFGPRLDRILINMYATDIAEFVALETGQIDVVDWPLTKFYLTKWGAPPYSDWIKTYNYGGEAGYYLFDLNNNNNQFLGNPPGTAPNPRYPEPLSVLSFRQAIAYLSDRTFYVNTIAEGMGLTMYVPVPNYMSPPLPPGVMKYEEADRTVARGKADDLLDEDGFEWGVATVPQTTLAVPANPPDMTITVANPAGFAVNDWIFIKKPDHTMKHMRQIKEIAGNVLTLNERVSWLTDAQGFPGRTYPVGSLVIKCTRTAVRYWDRNGNEVKDAGEDFTIKIWGRSDHSWRNDMAIHISGELNVKGVATELLLRVRQECSDNVFGAKNFDIYTGGWIFIGPDPDYLYDLYHSDMYWHPGKPPNYAIFPKDTTNDDLLEAIKFANTPEEGMTAMLDWMVYWSAKCLSVALFSTSGYKSYRLNYLGTPGTADLEDPYEGDPWYGILNENGFGVNSWWSFLNAHPDAHETGSYVAPGPGQMTMRYGFKTTEVSWLNPIYAQWYWDWETIGKIYDAGAGRDPYNKQLWVPQLFKRWVAGTWVDPVTLETKTKVTLTIRPDAYWQDGTPFSVADVEYTLVELSKDLAAKHLPMPWFYPTVQFMRSFYQVDAYTIEILMDVKSTYAMGWVIGTVIIPKHIWKPIVDASSLTNNIVYGRNPDKNMIGTGPYRLKDYFPLPAVPMRILLVANKPGSTVQTNFENTLIGDVITSPYGYYNQEPTYLNVLPEDGKFKRNLAHAAGVKPVATTSSFKLNITEQNRDLSNAITVDKYVYIDKPIGVVANTTGIVIAPGATHSEQISLTLGKGVHTINVAKHVTAPPLWESHWENVTVKIWVTIAEDIGLQYFDTWHTTVPKEVPIPDGVVDIDDIVVAALAFGTIPGHPRWSQIGDLTGDAKCDIDDIILLALMFGKWP